MARPTTAKTTPYFSLVKNVAGLVATKWWLESESKVIVTVTVTVTVSMPHDLTKFD
jgi:hypothetical protein